MGKLRDQMLVDLQLRGATTRTQKTYLREVSNFASCREFLGTGKTVTKENIRQETWQEQLHRICGIDVTICPVCQKGRMSRMALLLLYQCNSPPELFR